MSMTRLVGCHLPSAQSGWGPNDVLGLLLGEFPDGWWIVAEHVSSSPGFSKHDITAKANAFEGVPFEWIGEQTGPTLTAQYPPGGPPKGDDDDADVRTD